MSQLEFEKEKEVEQNTTTYGGQLELEDPKKPDENTLIVTITDELIEEVNDEINDDIKIPEAIDEDVQYDIFGNPVEDLSKKKKPAVAATSKSSKPSKPKEETKFGMEYTVYYAGSQIPVPQDDMTLEQVRAYLEMDFPELSKERTDMTYDSTKKQIVPVVKGGKRG